MLTLSPGWWSSVSAFVGPAQVASMLPLQAGMLGMATGVAAIGSSWDAINFDNVTIVATSPILTQMQSASSFLHELLLLDYAVVAPPAKDPQSAMSPSILVLSSQLPTKSSTGGHLGGCASRRVRAGGARDRPRSLSPRSVPNTPGGRPRDRPRTKPEHRCAIILPL